MKEGKKQDTFEGSRLYCQLEKSESRSVAIAIKDTQPF